MAARRVDLFMVGAPCLGASGPTAGPVTKHRPRISEGPRLTLGILSDFGSFLRERPVLAPCGSGVRGAGACPIALEDHLVQVAPVPVLAPFERLDQGVPAGVEVRGGMPAGRAVATTDVPAGRATAQVEPPATRGEAFDAAVTTRRRRGDGFQVPADVRQGCLLSCGWTALVPPSQVPGPMHRGAAQPLGEEARGAARAGPPRLPSARTGGWGKGSPR